jgi:hypothetical protein
LVPPLVIVACICRFDKPIDEFAKSTSWPNDKHPWQVIAGSEMVPEEVRHRINAERD